MFQIIAILLVAATLSGPGQIRELEKVPVIDETQEVEEVEAVAADPELDPPVLLAVLGRPRGQHHRGG